MLRKHVNEQFSTVHREAKKVTKQEVEKKARAEVCKLEWLFTKELYKVLKTQVSAIINDEEGTNK